MPRIRIATLFGIPLLVDLSWLALFAFVVWMLWTQVFPETAPDASGTTHLVLAVISAALLFASVIVHELAHSVIAKLYKIPVKSITLFLFGGVAQISKDVTKPSQELLMAGIGPLTSIAIGAVLALGWWLSDMGSSSPAGAAVLWLSVTNIFLGVFNLIPLYPLDGGRVFRSLLWMVTRNYYRSTVIASWSGRVLAWTLIAVGVAALAGLLPQAFSNSQNGAVIAFMGLYLDRMARQGQFQNSVLKTLAQYKTRDLMLADPPVIETTAPIEGIARNAMSINPHLCFFVEEHGALAGILSSYQLLAIPEALWATTTAGEAMLPKAKLKALNPETAASDALVEMEGKETTHLPVVEDGRVLGVLARERVLRVLQQAGLLPQFGPR